MVLVKYSNDQTTCMITHISPTDMKKLKTVQPKANSIISFCQVKLNDLYTELKNIYLVCVYQHFLHKLFTPQQDFCKYLIFIMSVMSLYFCWLSFTITPFLNPPDFQSSIVNTRPCNYFWALCSGILIECVNVR